MTACLVFAGPVGVEEADLVQQQFEEAMDSRESGKVFDAIKIFENILATNPYLNRARLELAVAYHEASMYEQAINQFQIVLDDPDKWNRETFQELIDSNETRRVYLPKPMPLILLYTTCRFDENGDIVFKKDVYKRDRAVLEGLNEEFTIWQRRSFN